MGCCNSKQQHHHDLYIDVPRDVSTTDKWALREKSFVGGCKLLPFTASCPASYPYQTLTRVVLGEDHLFAALWEGHGGAQAARHCVAACYETLQQCLQSNSDPCWALKQATHLLDEAFMASDLPDLVKARVGATGLMMYLNTRNNHCYVGRMGNAQPFVSAAQGSFNTININVRDLSPGQSCVSPSQSGWDQQPSRTRGATTSSGGGSCSVASEAETATPAEPLTVTHAVGMGYGKSKKLQELWLKHQPDATGLKQQLQQRQLPFITDECEVSMSQLAAGDETLVLAGEGLMQVLTAQEVGMLLHHFNAARLNELKQAYTAAAPQQEEQATPQAAAAGGRAAAKAARSRGSSSSGTAERRSSDDAVAEAGKLSRHTNVANIVIHQALMKALEQHNAQRARLGALEQSFLLSYDQLVRLPLVVDVEAFRPGGAAGDGVHLQLPTHHPSVGLSKRDIHTDMGLVVICLNRPWGSDGGLMPGMPSQRPAHTISRPDAQYRWQLLRLAVKCRVAYKRSLRRRWWQLVGEAAVAAEAAAREAEVRAWKVMGAAVKVNLKGDVFDPEAPIRNKHSPAHKQAAATTTHVPPPRKVAHSSSMAAAAAATAAVSSSRSSSTAGRAAAQGPNIPNKASVPAGNTATAPGAARACSSSGGCSGKSEGNPPSLGHRSSSAGSSGSSGRSKKPTPLVVTPLAAAIGSCAAEVPDLDIESPSKRDSPSKPAYGGHQAWASSPNKKGTAAMSPTKAALSPSKAAHANLSLRSGRAGAIGVTEHRPGEGSSSPARGLADAGWTTSSSRDSAATANSLSLRGSKGMIGALGSVGKAGVGLGGGSMGSSGCAGHGKDYDGGSSPTKNSASSLRGSPGSPSKMSNQKISLRKAAAAAGS